jgi:glycosyltransferase involved in cell wall biosynthesis
MNVPLVSITLCTFNGSAYLKEQLDSLVAQTYTNLEVIIVDDGSTDDTITLLKHYADIFPQLNVSIYINEENLGHIRNFEKAIGLCTGEYIALCDQDDIWEPQKISLLVDNIGDNMLIYHDSAFISETGEILGKKMSDVRNCYSDADSRVFLFDNCVSGHAVLFKRELLKYTDRFKSEIMHDWWLAYVATNAGSILFLNQTLVQYRQHSHAKTDILRQKQSVSAKRGSLEKIEKELRMIQLFSGYLYNKDTDFKNKLVSFTERRMHSYISFSLAYFIFKHRRVLLYIKKKSALSKYNFILKYIWGYKTKQLLGAS